MATRPVRVQRREGRRITRYEEPEFEQTRYDLRVPTGGAGRRYYGPHDEEQDRGGGRYYAKRMPSPTRVGRRRARSPSPDVYRETARRRREYPAPGKRAAAVASAAPPAEEGYETHPLDEFDRFMLAKRRHGRPREHIRPAAREMERIAYPTGPVGLRRRRRREEEEEPAAGESENYPSEEEDEEYERFREQRQRRRLAGYDEERRGRQMTRRSDLVAARRGREEEEEGEGEEGEEGYEYYSPEEEEEEEGEGYSEEEEGEGLMSAPEELDEDEEFITGRRMPLRRRGADYGRGGTTQRFERRRGPEEEEERRAGGRGKKRGREEEREEEPQRRRKLPARKTHRHPTYEDMIAEALVQVGKNGKASGVAIFKYIHDHFDMPANDRLVRNHLHQAFERMIDDGKLRHKKASYVLPRNLLTEYSTKYGAAGEETQQKAGEKKQGEAEQGAERPRQEEPSQEKAKTTDEAQEKTAAGGEQPAEKGAAEEQAGGEGTTTKKGGGGRKRSR